jgi:DNA topoisomerase VI subunit B
MTDTMTTLAEAQSDREYREFVKMSLSEVGSSTVTDTWEVVKLQTTHYTVNMRVRGGWTIVKTQWTEDGWTTSSISNVLQNCNADGLAFETRWFGEGKECLVKEMREVCTSTGHSLVLHL